MDAGGGCRVQLEGKIKEGPNLLERHTPRFEAAEGCVKKRVKTARARKGGEEVQE